MPNLGEFFTSLSKKAGINIDTDDLKAFISNESLSKIEIPDTLQKGLDNSLISLTDAKNNHPDIKKVYTAQALAPIDNFVLDQMSRFEMDEDSRLGINQERNTFKKLPMLIDKITELKEKKLQTSDRTEKAAFTKEIERLNKEVAAIREEKENVVKEYNNKEKNMEIRYQQDSMFSQYKTVFDELPAKVRNGTLRNLFNQWLQDNSAENTFDDEGRFILRKKDGTNFYGENNQQVNIQQALDKVFSQNKILVTTPPAGATGATTGKTSSTTGHGQTPIPANGNGGAGNTGSEGVKNLNKASLTQYNDQLNNQIVGAPN